MSWSFKLITVSGIPIRVHVSFLAVVAWAAWIGFNNSRGRDIGASIAFTVLFFLLLFLCVVLHELGHSLVAQAVGVKVHDITLWPIGGIARLAAMPRRPLHEFLITAAGPAVNVVLAVVLSAVALAWIGPERILIGLTTGRGLSRLLGAETVQSLVLLLALQNIVLAIFNLIPAFPMDGGRLLRSALAGFVTFRTATRVASWVGQALAIGLIGASLLPPGNFMLTLVGGFVFLGAWQERNQMATLDNLRGLTVRDAMQPVGQPLARQDLVGDVVARIGASPRSAFAVVENGRLAGLITRSMLLASMRKAGRGLAVAELLPATTPTIAPDVALQDALERLEASHAAVVVEGGIAVGLISSADIARLAATLEIMRSSPARRR